MLNRPHLIGSEIFRRTGQGSMHPLASPKVSAMIDLVRALGWLEEDIYIDSPKVTPTEAPAVSRARLHRGLDGCRGDPESVSGGARAL
jgi:hypothetical protein